LDILLLLEICYFHDLKFRLLLRRFLLDFLDYFRLFCNYCIFSIFHLLLLLLFLHSLHYLLLGYLSLFSCLAWSILYNSFSLLCEVLPNQIENFLGIIRSKWWPDCFSLNLNANKIFFILSFGIKWEPIVHVSGANSPFVGSFSSILNRNKLNLFEQDGLGSGQREIILKNGKISVCDEDSMILI